MTLRIFWRNVRGNDESFRNSLSRNYCWKLHESAAISIWVIAHWAPMESWKTVITTQTFLMKALLIDIASNVFHADSFNASLVDDSSSKQDILHDESRRLRYRTLNPDELDFELGGSNNDLSISDDEESGSLSSSLNLGDLVMT
jgi:hypothetical protein